MFFHQSPILFLSSHIFKPLQYFCLFPFLSLRYPVYENVSFFFKCMLLILSLLYMSPWFISLLQNSLTSRFMLQNPWAVSLRYLQQTPLSCVTKISATNTPELYDSRYRNLHPWAVRYIEVRVSATYTCSHIELCCSHPCNITLEYLLATPLSLMK